MRFVITFNKLCGRPPQYTPAPCKLTFDSMTLKLVSESCVTWDTSVPILVFLGLSVLDLGSMYTRQTDRSEMPDRQTSDALPLPYGRGHNKVLLRMYVRRIVEAYP